jgi:hypothetical protein
MTRVTVKPAEKARERPTLVASLPGSTGATILRLKPGRALRVVPLAPVAAPGTITLGGLTIAGAAG